MCVHVAMCMRASVCTSAPCTRVRCVPLCMRVPPCICPARPCARGRLCWPRRQCPLPGLAWGSALGTAPGSRRLIPSRCGCREPGSALRPPGLLAGGCRSGWSRQSSRLPGSCIAAGLFTARCSRLSSSAAAAMLPLSPLGPGAGSDRPPAPGRDGAGGPALPLPAHPCCWGHWGHWDGSCEPCPSPAALPGRYVDEDKRWH